MKDIPGYEGLYAVTSCGKVWSYRSKKFLKPELLGGYLRVCLTHNYKQEHHFIHVLVAKTYIPNPNNLPQVNHLDEDKTNNCIFNLEWTTLKENCNYGTRNERIATKHYKSVFCVELNRVFNSPTEAAEELKINRGNIYHCCNGLQHTAAGYHWKYVEQ